MPDLSQFQSDSLAWNFSKGPKSLYYANGDEGLGFGVVLNVPQTDDDDEWGQTERIALERNVDRIGTLIEEVEDPVANNGLLQKMDSLVGTGGIINLSVPSIGLCGGAGDDITLSGGTGLITIQNGMTLSSRDLTLGNDLVISRVSSARYRARYKTKVDVAWVDDDTSNYYIDLRVGDTTYRFKDGEADFQNDAQFIFSDVTVCGDLQTANVNVSGDVNATDVKAAYLEIDRGDPLEQAMRIVGFSQFCGNVVIGDGELISTDARVRYLEILQLSPTSPALTIMGTSNICGDMTIGGNVQLTSGELVSIDGRMQYLELRKSPPDPTEDVLTLIGKSNFCGELTANWLNIEAGVGVTGIVMVGNATICGTVNIADGNLNTNQAVNGTNVNATDISAEWAHFVKSGGGEALRVVGDTAVCGNIAISDGSIDISDGNITTDRDVIASDVNVREVLSLSAASLPSATAGIVKLWFDVGADKIKYITSVGGVKTIDAS